MIAITSKQLQRLGAVGKAHPDHQWFISFYAEEGDPDMYVQSFTSMEMWKINPEGDWAYLGKYDEDQTNNH